MAIFPPWHMLSSISRKAMGEPDILQTNIEPFPHPQLLLYFYLHAGIFRVDDFGDTRFVSELQAVGIHVRDYDVARPGKLRDYRGHDADGASSGNQHVLSEYRKREGRVNGVAERIKNRRDFQ